MNTLINELDSKKSVTDLKDETIRYIQQSSPDEAVIKEWTIKKQEQHVSGAYCGCRCRV